MDFPSRQPTDEPFGKFGSEAEPPVERRVHDRREYDIAAGGLRRLHDPVIAIGRGTHVDDIEILELICKKIINRSQPRPDLKWASDLAKMLQVSFLGYATAGAFRNLSIFDLFYHMLAIIVLTRIVVGRVLTQPATSNGLAPQWSGKKNPSDGPSGQSISDGHTLGGASDYLI